MDKAKVFETCMDVKAVLHKSGLGPLGRLRVLTLLADAEVQAADIEYKVERKRPDDIADSLVELLKEMGFGED